MYLQKRVKIGLPEHCESCSVKLGELGSKDLLLAAKKAQPAEQEALRIRQEGTFLCRIFF